MLSQEHRDRLLCKAYNAAIRAGAAILEHYKDEDYTPQVEIKSDKTPITAADRAAHNTIKSYLGSTHIPVLSEEGREMLYQERCNWELFWLVDPLDGTKEFLKRNGEFTVNIALVSDNKPILGVVYVPFLKKIFFADTEKGAFRRLGIGVDKYAEFDPSQIYERAESLPVTATHNTPIRVAISRSHNTPETFKHIDRLRLLHPDIEVVEQGSSYKFCLLAEGEVDCYIRNSNTYEWDTAAGELILSLSGGKTLSMPGLQPLGYNKESIENPHFVCRSKFFTPGSH